MPILMPAIFSLFLLIFSSTNIFARIICAFRHRLKMRNNKAKFLRVCATRVKLHIASAYRLPVTLFDAATLSLYERLQ